MIFPKVIVILCGEALAIFFQMVAVAQGFDTFWTTRLLSLSLSCILFSYVPWRLTCRWVSVAFEEGEGDLLKRSSYHFLPSLLLLEYPFLYPHFERYRSLDFNLPLVLLGGVWGLIALLNVFFLFTLWRRKSPQKSRGWLLGKGLLLGGVLCLQALAGMKAHEALLMKHLDKDLLYFTLFNETRAALLSPINKPWEREWLIPAHGALQIGYGVLSEDWSRRNGGVAFTIFLETEDGAKNLIYSKHIKDKAFWTDDTIDLSSYGERKGRFIFKAEGSQNLKDRFLQRLHVLFSYPHPLWNRPRLYQAGSETDGLNLLLIAIDALRADRLGCEGYWAPISPNIDEIAREGILFKRAISHAPWTFPSFSSIFTSRLPSSHGGGLRIIENNLWTNLSPHNLTLSEVLKSHGYFTGAFVNNPCMEPKFGLHQGFDTYYQYLNPSRYQKGKDASVGTDLTLEWLKNNAHSRFFLFLHYFDPHVPYQRHEEEEEKLPSPQQYLTHLAEKALPLEKERLEKIADSWRDYDDEVAYVDEHVGHLMDQLKSLGLYEHTLVVILSDHGEEFGEHKGFHHGHSLYDELLHIPLIIHLPGQPVQGKVVEELTRAVDIGPTILDILGLPTPEEFMGESRWPLILNGHQESVTTEAFSEALMRGPEKKAITTQRYKYILTLKKNEEELYDLQKDPMERYNLVKAKPETAQFFRRKVEKNMAEANSKWWKRLSLPSKDARISEETKELLRSLGYLN